MARFSHTVMCISIFLAILPFLPQPVPVVNELELLDTVSGVVGAGNFSYWQLGHAGPLIIELLSLRGDADLYVSDSGRPSYEVDKNNFSSATCGPDVVMIPLDFPRPIAIGVFGDWSHSVSQYNIKVYLDSNKVWSEEEENTQRVEKESSDKEYTMQKKEKIASRKIDEDRPRFLNLLNVLDMIFEMFVL